MLVRYARCDFSNSILVRFLRATGLCCSAYMPRHFRLSVRPSVTRVLCVKTAEHIIEILSLSDRPIILVFRHHGPRVFFLNLTVSPLTGAPNTRGKAIFDEYARLYLENGNRPRWRHIYYKRRILSHMCSIEWCRFR